MRQDGCGERQQTVRSLIWLAAVVAVYALVIFGVAWLSVHPVRTPLFLSPGAMDLPQEDIEFISMDGIRIRGWWMDSKAAPRAPAPDAARDTVVILLHGYLMTRSELTPLAAKLWKEGCSCLLIDFRAHGSSGGKKCGVGWLERQEVGSAMAWVRERKPEARIVLVGSSMGAAALSFAAAEYGGASALILDCGYSRLSSAALGWWRFIGGKWLALAFAPTVLAAAPFVGVNPFKIDVAKALEKANLPTLLIHGDRDLLALPSEAERNLAACGEKGTLIWMPNSNHAEGRWIHPELYENAVMAFLRELDLI